MRVERSFIFPLLRTHRSFRVWHWFANLPFGRLSQAHHVSIFCKWCSFRLRYYKQPWFFYIVWNLLLRVSFENHFVAQQIVQNRGLDLLSHHCIPVWCKNRTLKMKLASVTEYIYIQKRLRPIMSRRNSTAPLELIYSKDNWFISTT